MSLGRQDECPSGEARHVEFGEHLRRCREAAGLTRKEIAGRLRLAGLKLSDSRYAKWEEGINRPNEYALVVSLANALNLAPYSEFRAQLLWLAGEWTERVEYGHGLPGPRCSRLVGRTELIDDVVGALRNREGPRLILLAASGGSGKTEVARYVAERMLDWKEFVDAGWLDLRTQEFDYTHCAVHNVRSTVAPSSVEAIVSWLALRLGCRGTGELSARLWTQRILIVVDNLETLPEEDRELAVSRLHELIGNGPSRAIITSRYDIVPPYLYRPKIDGLSIAATRELLSLAGSIFPRLSVLRRVLDEEVVALWTVTRGMPLALQLVVGQSQHFELAEIIRGLQHPRSGSDAADAMSTFLYRRAWDELSPSARAVLIHLAEATRSNHSDDQLADASPARLQYDPSTMSRALSELLRWFLIERANLSTDATYAYTLHPLTRSFVLSQNFRTVGEEDLLASLTQDAAVREYQNTFGVMTAPDNGLA